MTESSGRDGGNRAFQSSDVEERESLHGCRNLSHNAQCTQTIDSTINQKHLPSAHCPIPPTKLQTLKHNQTQLQFAKHTHDQ